MADISSGEDPKGNLALIVELKKEIKHQREEIAVHKEKLSQISRIIN